LVGPPLLLDTTIYIDVLSGRSVPEVARLLPRRIAEHSAVCVAELVHALGRLDPGDPRTKRSLDAISGVIADDIPPHRLHAPTTEMWATAGMINGLLTRLVRLSESEVGGGALLNDALIYAQAAALGCVLLTRNVRDFDLINQLWPAARVMFYR
jgi:predicted nucleic acid-binding protein